MTLPEPKSRTEQLDLQQKAEAIWRGQRPADRNYPYIAPDYDVPFLHIGTERQLFLDNFIPRPSRRCPPGGMPTDQSR